jgi:hypothetical protein
LDFSQEIEIGGLDEEDETEFETLEDADGHFSPGSARTVVSRSEPNSIFSNLWTFLSTFGNNCLVGCIEPSRFIVL